MPYVLQSKVHTVRYAVPALLCVHFHVSRYCIARAVVTGSLLASNIVAVCWLNSSSCLSFFVSRVWVQRSLRTLVDCYLSNGCCFTRAGRSLRWLLKMHQHYLNVCRVFNYFDVLYDTPVQLLYLIIV